MGNYPSDEEIERNMCKATHEALPHEGIANDNKPRFLRSTKTQRVICFKEAAGQLIIARKRHPNKQSKKNLDDLNVLAPVSAVQKSDQHKSVIRESGKLNVTVHNSDIAKFRTRDERKMKFLEYKNRRGPHTFEKSTEAKVFSHTKEFMRIQKVDRNMKHRKRDTASLYSSIHSNIARAMRVRLPKNSIEFRTT